MSILKSIGSFINRHRRKIFFSVGLIASGYFALDYLKNKFFEIQDRLATERSAKENLRRRFEQNQEDATFTIMALLPTLSSDIIESFPVESITHELQSKRNERSAAKSSSSALVAPASEAGTSDISNLTTSQFTDNKASQQDENTNDSNSSAPNQNSTSNSIVLTTQDSTILVDKAPRKSKTQLWQELKIESLTRLFTLIYATALLVFFTRLQLNILGRKNYILSVIEMADVNQTTSSESAQPSSAPVGENVDDESAAINLVDLSGEMSEPAVPDNATNTQQNEALELEAQNNRMYLTFSWWLLNKGWVSLSGQVREAVTRIFGPINPRTDLTLEQLSDLIGQVQYLIDHPLDSNTPQNFLANLLPPAELETYVLTQALSPFTDLSLVISDSSEEAKNEDSEKTDTNKDNKDKCIVDSNGNITQISETLRNLLDETADFIESPNAGDVIKRLVHTGLSVSVGKISQALYPSMANEPSKFNNLQKEENEDNDDVIIYPTVKFASILANISRQAHIISSGNPLEPNEFVKAMTTQVPDLDAFSAVVYSNFDWRMLDKHNQS